jgi:hypothetical protein
MAQSLTAEPAAQFNTQGIELRGIKRSQCFSLATNRRADFAQAGPAVDTQSCQMSLQPAESEIDPT